MNIPSVTFSGKGNPLPPERRETLARQLIRDFNIGPKDRHVLLALDGNHQGIRNRAYASLAEKYGITGQTLKDLKAVLRAF